MRATVTIAVPLDATGGQLKALASLLATVEAARWESLTQTFDRMNADHARLPEAIETMLGVLAGQLRIVAREREDDQAPATAVVAGGPGSGPRRR